MLSERTEHDYRQDVNRWVRDGRPEATAWVAARSGEAARRNARAAVVGTTGSNWAEESTSHGYLKPVEPHGPSRQTT
jgi:hypothetical protein